MNIGFIGLGEVTRTISAVIDKDNELYGFDKLLLTNSDIIRNRFEGINIHYIKNLGELIDKCDLIISAATTQAAVEIAETASCFMTHNKMFLDLNSMTPERKIKVADIISGNGIFIEGVILGAIGATGFKTSILVSGEKGEDLVSFFNKYGFKLKFYSSEIGKASKFKMVRSIFSKGVENLLIELLIAAEKAEISDEIWSDINNFMNSKTFSDIAENWIISHAYASRRRYYEMEQVIETAEELGIDPIMSVATKNFFKRSVEMGIEESFSEKPDSVKDVIKFFTNRI